MVSITFAAGTMLVMAPAVSRICHHGKPGMEFSVGPLHEDDVRAMLAWRYASPYQLYDLTGADDPATIREFLDPAQHYFAVRNAEGVLVGYCCFGAEARVPGWDYDEGALDVGVGMRPDLTGQGHGAAFTEAVLAFGLQRFPHARLRATVAAFNERSQRVCRRQGLAEVGRFVRAGAPVLEFVVLEGNAKTPQG